MNLGEEILLMLKDEISEIDYKRYIKQLKFSTKLSKSNHAIFHAPNALIANYINRKFADKIAHLFEVKSGRKPMVSIELKSTLTTHTKNTIKNVEEKVQHTLLNPSYTFENFVPGSSNQFAYAAAKNVSEKPGELYNPLFIYGGVGLGKTHLMQSVGNVLQHQGKSIIYTSVEQFLNDFTSHMRNKTMDRFKDKCRKCDVLLIDDVQFLSNKPQTQEEFFHTFEALRNENKQIIMTADKKPKQIAGLEDRLKSRFEWGLVADIQPPELETKIAIIQKKCEINRIILDHDVINYIATIIDHNVREIEGILSKLHAYAQLMHQPITIEFAQSVLKESLQESRDNISLDFIMSTVAKELNVKPSEIRSKNRSRNIVYTRRIAIYLSRELTPMSMPELAKYFGMKDHTAVSHTMKKINELLKNDEDFKVKIDELTNKIITSKEE